MRLAPVILAGALALAGCGPSDIASPGTFLSNFQPLDQEAAREITDDAITLSRFTPPMRTLLTDFVAAQQSVAEESGPA